MTEPKINVTDFAGYSEIYGAIDRLVHDATHPPFAAGAVLNAACAVALTTMPAETLVKMLRQTADRIPAEEAKARNQLS